ncbi:MAG TPA: DUF3800 domain-containing protein [Caulobacteraceae bacterium]
MIGETWVRRRAIMIIRAYLDESGSHAGSKHLVVGGYVGRLGQWGAFDKAWRRFIGRAQIGYLHTKEAKSGRGQFKNRPLDVRREFLVQAERLANKHLAFRLFVTLDLAEFERFYVADRASAQIHFDSAYGLCVRGCLSVLPQAIKKSMGVDTPRIELYMEDGHANLGDAARIFADFRRIDGEMFKQITFAGKTTPGLQIADAITFAAHQAAKRGEARVLELEHVDELPPLDRREHGKCPLVAMRLTEATLRAFRERALADVERRREWWRSSRSDD